MGKEKQSILVIEDSPIQIKVLSHILSSTYDVRVATSGKKGILLAQKYSIDLILLDIIMDDMTGFEVLDTLKKSERTKNIPVIFISSMDTSEDEVRGLSAGAVDYITKPFTNEVVQLRVGLHMKLIEQMRTIENLSLYDSLTGIRNRRSFNLTMQEEWEKAVDNGHSISMIMLDIDRFKLFNDKYGHLCGDICLKAVAHALKITRNNDLVFRWGGEEFAVLLPNTSLIDAERLAERLREAVAATPIEYKPGLTTTVTISLGAGEIFPQTTDTPELFCAEVDRALYKAKENGRNRVETI